VWQISLAQGEELEKRVKETVDLLQTVEENGLGEKKFFGGDNVGIADIAFGAVIHWLKIMEEIVGIKVFEAHKFPRLHEWTENFKQLPAVKENLPDWDWIVSYFKSYREKRLASA
jgi:glutathione S-transferase